MGLRFKINILKALKANGYTTTRLRKEKILGEYTIQSLRKGDGVSWSSIESLCALLKCQPGDILEYEEEAE